MKKFFTKKSVISDHLYKDIIFDINQYSDYIIPISLLTIMNGEQRKNKYSAIHGYDAAVSIEILILLMELLKSQKNLSSLSINIKQDSFESLKTSIIPLINVSINKNIEIISYFKTSSITNKIHRICSEQINDKINKIVTAINMMEIPLTTTILQKTDLYHFHFANETIYNKLCTIKIFPKEFIIKYLTETYGNICKLALFLGWTLGGSSHDMLLNLDRLGYHFGLLYGISQDFVNLNNDIEKCSSINYSFNYVINFGLQDAFEQFNESKEKFNEGLLTLKITSSTIKELIDLLDKRINVILEQSTPDIKRTTSSASIK
jgi:hypothetical protein